MPAPPFDNTISIGPLDFHLYGLILGIAIIAAAQLAVRLFDVQGIDRERAGRLIVPTVIMGIIGGRIYHILSRPAHFADHPAEMVRIWEGGLGIYGAVAFGMLTVLVYGRRLGLPLLRVLDAVAPGVVLGQAIGRWGNYVNEELYGARTTLPWGLEVTGLEGRYHPTFLYESLWNLAVCAVLVAVLVWWKSRPDGFVFLGYLAAYSVARFFIEGLRIDEAHSWMGLRQNEWVAAIVFAIAVAAMIMVSIRSRRKAAQTAS